ncbi:BED zinc finger [Abeliophyllum distichum]|uniref:BED zinc finger n=1 Tax=Abeliophyllum distichum TaxID=126358 RepID=A0ABD1QUF0_9LAMI
MEVWIQIRHNSSLDLRELGPVLLLLTTGYIHKNSYDTTAGIDSKCRVFTMLSGQSSLDEIRPRISPIQVYAEKTGTNVVRPPNPKYNSSSTDDVVLWSYVSTHRTTQDQQLVDSSSSSSILRSYDTLVELVRYYAYDVLSMLDDEERKNFDILKWWRQRQRSCPILSKMARDLLTHLVSTVASEAAFSISGRILSDIRSRLKVDILESLLCLKDCDNAELRIQDKVDRLMSEEFEDLNMD